MSDERHIAGAYRRVLQVRRENPRNFTKRKRRRFLAALAATCNVNLSAGEAGVGVSTCYNARARDEEFARGWRTALSIGYARLEEALLHYALTQAEAAGIDPAEVDPAEVEGSVHAKLARGTVTRSDLNFALGLLNRHRAGAEGRDVAGANGRRATREQTDAVLKKKLDSLARRLRQQRAPT